MIIVTGGAGFIGSNFLHEWFKVTDEPVINIDSLTYAGNKEYVKDLPNHQLIVEDINNSAYLDYIFHLHSLRNIRAVVHFAAESDVDRSIAYSKRHMDTNINGTVSLLEVIRKHWQREIHNRDFKFIYVSADEVYGPLYSNQAPVDESAILNPTNLYSASKAAAEHFVTAYSKTFGIPAIVTRCTNNYGPRQHPEKLIPNLITSALDNKPLSIYGTGEQIRDWIHVNDHCSALRLILEQGEVGSIYNIGSTDERTNISVAENILQLIDTQSKIAHVKDRLGHDQRYAVDSSKLKLLGWKPEINFEDGLQSTIEWYRQNA